MKEETGYRALNIKKLGTFYALAGVTNMKIHFFKAWNLVKTDKRELDKTEFIENKLVPVKEFKKKILSKKIKDLPLAFCFLLDLYLN